MLVLAWGSVWGVQPRGGAAQAMDSAIAMGLLQCWDAAFQKGMANRGTG